MVSHTLVYHRSDENEKLWRFCSIKISLQFVLQISPETIRLSERFGPTVDFYYRIKRMLRCKMSEFRSHANQLGILYHIHMLLSSFLCTPGNVRLWWGLSSFLTAIFVPRRCGISLPWYASSSNVALKWGIRQAASFMVCCFRWKAFLKAFLP